MSVEKLLADIFIEKKKSTIVNAENNAVPPPSFTDNEILIQEIGNKVNLSSEESSLFIMVCRYVKEINNAIVDFKGCVQYVKETRQSSGIYENNNLEEILSTLLTKLSSKSRKLVSIIRKDQKKHPIIFFLKVPFEELSISIYNRIKAEEEKEYSMTGTSLCVSRDVFVKKHELDKQFENVDRIFQFFKIEDCALASLREAEKYEIVIINLLNEDIVIPSFFSVDTFVNNLIKTVKNYYLDINNINFTKIVMKNINAKNQDITNSMVKDILTNNDYQNKYFLIIIQIIANLVELIKVKKIIRDNQKGQFQQLYIASQFLYYFVSNELKDVYKKEGKEREKSIEKKAIIKFLLTHYGYDNQLGRNIYSPITINDIRETTIQNRDFNTGKLKTYHLYDRYTEESLGEFLKEIIFEYTKLNLHQIFFLKYKNQNCYFHIIRTINIVFSIIELEKKEISTKVLKRWKVVSKKSFFFLSRKKFYLLVNECVSSDFKKIIIFIKTILVSVKPKSKLKDYFFLSNSEIEEYSLENTDLVLDGSRIAIDKEKRLSAFFKLLFEKGTTLKPYYQIVNLDYFKFLKLIKKSKMKKGWKNIFKTFFKELFGSFSNLKNQGKENSYDAVPVTDNFFEIGSRKNQRIQNDDSSIDKVNLRNINQLIEEQHELLNQRIGEARDDFREALDDCVESSIVKVDHQVFIDKKLEILKYMAENLPIAKQISNKEALIEYLYLKGLKKIKNV